MAAHLLLHVLDAPGSPFLFLQDVLADGVCDHWNPKLTRPVDVIPVVMGIEDTAYRRKITPLEFRSELASQTRAVAGVDQQTFIPRRDHTNATLYCIRVRMVRQNPGMFGKLCQPEIHSVDNSNSIYDRQPVEGRQGFFARSS